MINDTDSGVAYRQNGSILIIVLWILMIIAFLAGQYLVHNKNKAELALNAMEGLKRHAVVDSFFALYKSVGWNSVKAGHKPLDWIGFTLDSMKFFVRLDSEGARININTAGDMVIRDKIREIFEQSNTLKYYDKKANELTDAILDWRDADNLVRLNGAEKEYYIDLKKPYLPANGRFTTIEELLMVKGVTRTLFNGNLPQDWQNPDILNKNDYQDKVFQNKISNDKGSINKTSNNKKLQDGLSRDAQTRNKVLSLLNAFTVYPKSAKRIAIRIISGKNSVYSEVFIFNSNMKKLEHIYNFYYGQ